MLLTSVNYFASPILEILLYKALCIFNLNLKRILRKENAFRANVKP